MLKIWKNSKCVYLKVIKYKLIYLILFTTKNLLKDYNTWTTIDF